MTKPLLYLMLLAGGAFAAGAGVVGYGEWRAAQQSAAPVATLAAPEREVAADPAPPPRREPARAEESLATPRPLPAAPAAEPQPRQPAGSEVAVLPEPTSPAGEPPAEPAAPQAPAAEPDEAVVPPSPPVTAEPIEPAVAESPPVAAVPSTPAAPERPSAATEPSEPAVPESPPIAAEPSAPATASGSAPREPVEAPAELEPASQPQESAVLPPAEPPAPVDSAEAAPPAMPTFDIVRVEPTGEAVIAGSAPGGAKVQILSNDEVVAETSADRSGNWVALPERPLRPGSHDLTIRAVGEAGGETASEQHVAIAVPRAAGEEVVAVLGAPGRPSAILAAPSPQQLRTAEPPQKLEPMATASSVGERRPPVVSVDAVEAEGRTLFVAGAGDPGALVRVYVDGDLVGEAEAGAGGRWLVEASRALEEGEVTVRADQLKAGSVKVEARAEVPFVRRLDMAALVPAVRAGAGGGDRAEGEELPQPGAVIIRRGDNLWTISRRTYGRGIRYTTIYRANEDQIRDPHWIYPGQVFVLPTGDRAWSER